MSSEITDDLVAKLAAFGKQEQTSPRVDDLKDGILDYAYDNYDFEGDEDGLWEAVKSAMTETLYGAAQSAPLASFRSMRKLQSSKPINRCCRIQK